MTDSKPLDLRTPEEQRRDASDAVLVNLCESSRLLEAFRTLGSDQFWTVAELAEALGLPNVEHSHGFLQGRLNYLVDLDEVSRDNIRYKVNLLKFRSAIRKS